MTFFVLRRSLQFQVGVVMATATAIPLVALPDLGTLFVPMLVMISPLMSQRATAFEVALPIRAREIFLVRSLSALAAVCLPIVAWIVTAQVRGAPAGALPDLFAVSLGVKLEMLGIAMLAVILPNLVRPGELVVPPSQSTLLPWAGLAIGAAAAMYFLTPPVVVPVLALAVVVGFSMAWRAVPQSFQVAPFRASRPARGVTVPGGASSARTSEARWWRPMQRSVLARAIIIGSFAMGGYGFNGTWIGFLGIWVMIDLYLVRQQTRWMDGLPLSHRRLLWINLVPAALPLVAVWLIGSVAVSFVPGAESIDLHGPHAFSKTHNFQYRTNVSLTFWERAPNGQAQVIHAPWGETSAADTLQVFGLTFYNPYSAEKSSSKEFVDWQFERATTAVYGRPISFEAYDADGAVLPPRVIATLRMFILGAGLALAFVLFVVFLCELPRWHLLGRRSALRHGATTLSAVFVFGLMVLELYYSLKHRTNVVVPLTEAVLFRLSRALPSTLLAVVIAAIPVIAMYYLALWQFRRSEWVERGAQQRLISR